MNFTHYLKVISDDYFRPLSAGDGGVGKRKNAATGEQEDEEQVGAEVKGGAP